MGRSDHFINVRLVEFELGQIFHAPVPLRVHGHLFFAQHEILQHQRVHVRGQETTVGLLRRADDRLARTLKLVFTITGQPVSRSNAFISR